MEHRLSEVDIPQFDDIPLVLIAIGALALMLAVAAVGHRLRQVSPSKGTDSQEAYIVSAVLGLLALFMGFTLALSLDRYETRRALVLQEANAIGTAYLRTQLLPEPHRARLTALLTNYLQNRLDLQPLTDSEFAERLQRDDQLMTDIWAATAAAFDAIKELNLSLAYLDAINAVLDLDTSRRTAHAARVPIVVFAVLFVFILIASCMLGYVLTGRRGRATAVALLAMLGLALLLMLDIDRPSRGLVQASQEPLKALQLSITSQPASVFDKWRTPP